jgi:hypothetical protein
MNSHASVIALILLKLRNSKGSHRATGKHLLSLHWLIKTKQKKKECGENTDVGVWESNIGWGGGAGTSGRAEEVKIGCGMVNMVQILCTHVSKWKNETC